MPPLRLLDLAKSQGITVLCISLVAAGANALEEATAMQISTIADTWIHLSYVIRGGERNRALTVVEVARAWSTRTRCGNWC